MQKATSPTWDHLKLLLFVVFLAELVLLFLAILFGRNIGYHLAMKACFWFGVIVAACFLFIILGNILVIGCSKISQLIQKRNSAL